MSYKIPKKSVIFLLIAAVVGFVFYSIAPPDIQPGQYSARLRIEAITLDFDSAFNLTISEASAVSEEEYSFIGTGTNATIKVREIIPLDTGSTLKFLIHAVGAPIKAEDISLHVWNNQGFNITLRPTKQDGQTFTIEYQPLVKSKAAIMILGIVAVLWFSEGISLVATSMMIPIAIVLTGITSPNDALAPFFDPAVALILGGFLIGQALCKYELDKRLALLILSKSASSGASLLLSVMAVSAFLSMWISNTASAAIMIPIALAVISRIRNDDTRDRYGKALVLGVAYSATIGGVGSLVGSTPNPLAATYVKSFLGIEISFIGWLPFGLPVVIIMIPIIWLWLLYRFKVPRAIDEIQGMKEIAEKEYLRMGPMTTQQKIVTCIFVSVIFLWFTQTLPDFISNIIGWSGHGISSAIVSLMGGLALLVFGLLNEKDVSSDINWSALLILGSGIALGASIINTGVSTYLALQMAGLGILPTLVIIIILGILAVILTMVASNTAAAVILIPIAIPLAIGLSIDPLLVTMIIAIGVSLDFALPTGTPPSTIAYSTGRIQIREMISTGLILDLIATLVLTLGVIWLWAFFGLVTL
jgi:sodium-dependent dicarboxylate transporter 2/3/5